MYGHATIHGVQSSTETTQAPRMTTSKLETTQSTETTQAPAMTTEKLETTQAP